jgi:hypothetical protein
MSLKALSLGLAAAAAACITVTGSTNATPIVVTLGDGHGLADGSRLAIAGITGNTAANGEWTLKFTAENTAQLVGSAGNGVHGGTPRAAVICDTTPFGKGHSAVLSLSGNLVGTVAIEAYDSYADFAAGTNGGGTAVAPVPSPSDVTNTTGNTSTTPASSSLVMAAGDTGREVEVKLARYMRAVVSAYTSGQIRPVLKA